MDTLEQGNAAISKNTPVATSDGFDTSDKKAVVDSEIDLNSFYDASSGELVFDKAVQFMDSPQFENIDPAQRSILADKVFRAGLERDPSTAAYYNSGNQAYVNQVVTQGKEQFKQRFGNKMSVLNSDGTMRPLADPDTEQQIENLKDAVAMNLEARPLRSKTNSELLALRDSPLYKDPDTKQIIRLEASARLHENDEGVTNMTRQELLAYAYNPSENFSDSADALLHSFASPIIIAEKMGDWMMNSLAKIGASPEEQAAIDDNAKQDDEKVSRGIQNVLSRYYNTDMICLAHDNSLAGFTGGLGNIASAVGIFGATSSGLEAAGVLAKNPFVRSVISDAVAGGLASNEFEGPLTQWQEGQGNVEKDSPASVALSGLENAAYGAILNKLFVRSKGSVGAQLSKGGKEAIQSQKNLQGISATNKSAPIVSERLKAMNEKAAALIKSNEEQTAKEISTNPAQTKQPTPEAKGPITPGELTPEGTVEQSTSQLGAGNTTVMTQLDRVNQALKVRSQYADWMQRYQKGKLSGVSKEKYLQVIKGVAENEEELSLAQKNLRSLSDIAHDVSSTTPEQLNQAYELVKSVLTPEQDELVKAALSKVDSLKALPSIPFKATKKAPTPLPKATKKAPTPLPKATKKAPTPLPKATKKVRK